MLADGTRISTSLGPNSPAISPPSLPVRAMMVISRLKAASAAFTVGYESASQFNREYSRQFGAPPIRDIKRLMQSAHV